MELINLMKVINININKYFHMISLWKSPIKLPVELPVELSVDPKGRVDSRAQTKVAPPRQQLDLLQKLDPSQGPTGLGAPLTVRPTSGPPDRKPDAPHKFPATCDITP